MMKHFLNDIEITPLNYSDIAITADFTGRPNELELSTDSIELSEEAYKLVKDWISQRGIMEGIPYRIELGSTSLDYYIDLVDNNAYKTYSGEFTIKKRFGKDAFLERANGLSFELMAKKGVNFESFNVPYVIIKDNAIELGVTLSISLFVMTRELIQAVSDLSNSVGDVIEAVTLSVGLGVVVPLGEIISLTVRLIAQLIYTATILIAVIKLGKQLFELMFPKIRNFLGAKVKTLLSKGCEYLGYSFESTLLDQISGLTVLPKPIKVQTKSFFNFLQNDLNNTFNKGYPTAQDSTPMLGDLFREIEKAFNAQTRVKNGVVRLELDTYWENNSALSIEPALVEQGTREDNYRYNVNDIWKRYYISYQVDYSDIHTANDFEGSDSEYSTEPTGFENEDLVSIKGLNEVSIAFSLGSRKNSLNYIEQVAKALFKVIDTVTGIFGGGTNLVSKINNRIGVLQISQQFFGVTKLLYTVGGKQPPNYLDYIGAKALWNNYHYLNQIQLENAKIREDVPIVLNDEEFLSLTNNNYMEFNGEKIEVLTIEYFGNDNEPTIISYKEPDNYAVGKVTTLTIN